MSDVENADPNPLTEVIRSQARRWRTLEHAIGEKMSEVIRHDPDGRPVHVVDALATAIVRRLIEGDPITTRVVLPLLLPAVMRHQVVGPGGGPVQIEGVVLTDGAREVRRQWLRTYLEGLLGGSAEPVAPPELSQRFQSDKIPEVSFDF